MHKLYNELSKYGDYIAGRYWTFYRRYYENISMDLDDLRQEAHIVTWRVLEKYKNKEDDTLRKIVRATIGMTMNKFIFRARIEKKPNLYHLANDKITHEELETILDEHGDDIEVILEFFDDARYLEELEKPPFLFDDIKKFCTKQEYTILYKRFFENRTLAEIGKLFSIGPERVRQIQNRILKKLKFHLKKELFCV
jgi:RNA polymerase sigma factor (sigma-70 family)